MAFLTLAAGETVQVSQGNFDIFGTDGSETVILGAPPAGGSLIVDLSGLGGNDDVIQLAGAPGDYTIVRSGSSVVISGNGIEATIPVSTTSKEITFANGDSADLVATPDGNGGATFTFGNQEVGNQPTQVEGDTSDGGGNTGGNAGDNLDLTTGVDDLVGTANNDTFTGLFDNPNFGEANDSTFTPLDELDGGDGVDTFDIQGLGPVSNPGGESVSNIENINIRGASSVSLDTTDYTGVEQLNVLLANGAVNLDAGAETDVNVANVSGMGSIDVDGGNDVTISEPTTAGTISADGAAGDVDITAGMQGGNNVTASAAGSVDIAATGNNGGAVTATGGGDINVSSTGAAYAQGTSRFLGTIQTNGGESVVVNQAAASSTAAAATDTNAQTHFQGFIDVNGSDDTTSVSVTQSESVAARSFQPAQDPTAGVKEVDRVTFSSLLDGASATVAGLTFTNTSGGTLSAADVAAAFANLSRGDTAGDSPASDGVYSGTFGPWSTGAASGSSVTATSVANSPMDIPTSANVTVAEQTNGVVADPGSPAVSGRAGVQAGTVDIDGDNIETASVDGFAGGSSITSDALASLSLANGDNGATFTINTDAATDLDLAVNDVDGTIAFGGDDTFTSLDITSSGAASDINLDGGDEIESITVSGDADLDLALDFAAGEQESVTSFDASGLDADLEVTGFDATQSSYTGATGDDDLSLVSGVANAINLGNGDDSVDLASGTIADYTANINGGAGTDTLVLDSSEAASLSANGTFEGRISGFEALQINGPDAGPINLANLDDISNVSIDNDATLQNFTAGGTLTFAGPNFTQATVTVASAAAGVNDELNVVINNAATRLATAGVETINITVLDGPGFDGFGSNDIGIANVALETINVTGAGDLVIFNQPDPNTGQFGNPDLIDASTMTGDLEAGMFAVGGEIIGGSGDDFLYGSAGTLSGNEGNDTLQADFGGANMTLLGGEGDDILALLNSVDATFTGGAGSDTFAFDFNAAIGDRAVITDFTSEDALQVIGATGFENDEVDVSVAANLADAIDIAANNGATGELQWFQFRGNTYIVQDNNGTADFQNGDDFVVQLEGLIDFSDASFNSDLDTVELPDNATAMTNGGSISMGDGAMDMMVDPFIAAAIA